MTIAQVASMATRPPACDIRASNRRANCLGSSFKSDSFDMLLRPSRWAMHSRGDQAERRLGAFAVHNRDNSSPRPKRRRTIDELLGFAESPHGAIMRSTAENVAVEPKYRAAPNAYVDPLLSRR